MPWELRLAVDKHMEWNDQQMSSYRIAWWRRWVARAAHLEEMEVKDAASRDPMVAKGKRLLLIAEMLYK